MSYQTHELKTIEPFYSAARAGKKDFEIRKNDRNFQVNDRVIQYPYDPVKKEYIKDKPPLYGVIKYMTNYEQKPGFVVLGLI